MVPRYHGEEEKEETAAVAMSTLLHQQPSLSTDGKSL